MGVFWLSNCFCVLQTLDGLQILQKNTQVLHSSVHLSPKREVPKLTPQPLSKARREIKHPANLKPTEKGLASPPQASESRVPRASPRCPWKQRPVGKAAPGPGGLQFRPPTHPSPIPPMGPARPAAPAPPLASWPGPDSQPQCNSAQGERHGRARAGVAPGPQAALSSHRPQRLARERAPLQPQPGPRPGLWPGQTLPLSHLRSHHDNLRQLDDVGAHSVEDVLELVDNRN